MSAPYRDLGGDPVRGSRVTASGWGWRHAGRRAWAVRDLDLDIEPGEKVLLLGPSGAGKSTLVHALAGVLGDSDDGDDNGRLLVDGLPPAAVRGRVGLVLQDPDSQVTLARVGDDVAFGCENLGVERDEIWRRVGQALDAVGLDLPLDHSTSRLSGGQKQRLALAGVLAMRPGLVLLDEPTANLDPVGVAEVRDAVARMLEHTKATLIVIEHRVGVWLPLVDRVIVLDPGGGLLADGHPEQVLAEEGARLAAQGVWVPGFPPAHPERRRAVSSVGPNDASSTDVLLCADDLSVARIPGTVVASGVRLTVNSGQALAVTGPNGSGKSTLALTLAGLLPTAGGDLRATDRLAQGAGSKPFRWKSRQLLTRIGTVFQDPEHQFLTATVRKELELGPRTLALSGAKIQALVDELLQRLRLDHLALANPFTLSGGEKRRLSVATALATNPQVLVLDEPTFGQDAQTWQELVALLAGLLDGGTALVAVTHDREFVEALADHTHELTSPLPVGPVR
ncbi:ABC transporter ATP-binding protein [Homoserinimonas sp. OAct 916]|uniref:ABC transporter ATP-binding protein n=1 Tax=Homoserinimonas sp. OAct 916 TaxID=2211450 RepID=UPI000DBE6B13|nr:ATP-binding cassette domain-containing protein [Homoserinimonas sp. OAct 916]